MSKTIQEHLMKRTGLINKCQKILDKCPRCLQFKEDNHFYCDVIPKKDNGLYFTYAEVSDIPCTIENMENCPLLRTLREIKRLTG
jgi:hypothetical protein